MTFVQLVAKIKAFAGGVAGRMKAYAVFMKGITGTTVNPVQTARSPLGEHLGYVRLELDEDRVMAKAKAMLKDAMKAAGEEGPVPIPTYEQLQPLILEEARRQAVLADLDPELVTADTLMGKDDQAWLEVEGSTKFDIGEHGWRVVDWLRPRVGDGWSALLRSFNLRPEKELLGDGVIAVVTGESIGLPADTLDFFQVRATVTNPSTGEIVSVGKGIIIVHPDAANVVAIADFYGEGWKRVAGPVVTFYDMAQGSSFNPRARYTLQGLYYQGVQAWHRFLFAVDNFRVSGDENALITEEKLVSANAPIHTLGGFGLIAVMTRLMRLTVTSGHSRMLLPAKAFVFIKGLEYVSQIEDIVVGDHDRSRPLADQHNAIPFYFAPEALKPYYERFRHAVTGVIRRLLNRRPDLSTGQCTRRFELADYLPFNALVIPSWALTIAGADFDGDLGVDFPVAEQGGLYVAFNDRSAEEIAERLAAATADRKHVVQTDGTVVASSKQNYASRSHRMAGQWEAKVVLGMSDVAARRFLDLADDLRAQGKHVQARVNQGLAYSLQAWTQASVDRQKRPVPWPNPSGTSLMPRAPQDEGEVYLVDLLRKVAKGDLDGEGMVEISDQGEQFVNTSAYAKAWAKFESKRQGLVDLRADLVYGEDEGRKPVIGDPARVVVASRWATEIYDRFETMMRHVPIMRTTGRPLPFEVNLPERTLTTQPNADLPAFKMQNWVKQLDHYWRTLVAAGGDVRAGAFNLKDGLREAAKQVKVSESLAELCHDFALFREFASVKQLEDYFEDIPGQRLSDLFPVVSGADFRTREHAPGKINVNPIQLAFRSFAPGQVVLKGHGHGRYHVQLPDAAFVVHACTPQDALIQLSGLLMDDHVDLVRAAYAADLGPQVAVPAVTADLASLKAAMLATIAQHDAGKGKGTAAPRASSAAPRSAGPVTSDAGLLAQMQALIAGA